VGRVVTKFLTSHFTRYVDYDFTARLEDELDAVARGEEQWIPLLESFWEKFKKSIDDAVPAPKPGTEPIGESCPKCGGGELLKRLGRRGMFIGCANYPDCDYTRNLDGEEERGEEPEKVEGRSCPDCGSDLVVKQGRYGRFIGCSAYPKCKFIEPLEKPEDTGVQCPECGKGSLLKKKSRRGKVFYSCSTYPSCTYAVWNPPLDQHCPSCGWPILTLKTTKRRGTEVVCPRKECGFARAAEDSTAASE
jgi:DNA topoisomerase-1